MEERGWLAAHDGKIVLAHDPNAKPIDYLDKKGEFRGLAADYVHLIEKKLNFKFDITHIKTWAEVIQKAKTKEVDVLCAMTETPAREKWLLFTKPYIVIPTVILVREDIHGTLTPEKMKGMKVTFTKGWVVDEYLRTNYGYLNLVPSIDEKAAMDSVSLGQADAWVTALSTSSILIEKHKITNLRVAGEIGLEFKLAVASRKDWPILNRIMQKGLSLISQKERDAIFNKWIHIDGNSRISKRVWIGLMAAAAAILLAIILTLLWNRTLRQQVAQRTIQLKGELEERKRAEAEIARSEALLNASLEQSPLGIIISDVPNKTVKVANEAFRNLFGISDEPTKNISLAGYQPSWKTYRLDGTVYEKIADTPLGKSISGKTVRSEEVRIVRKDGTERFASCNGTPIYNERGEVVAAFVAYLDITDKKLMENMLLQAQKMESIGRLAGGIAHDFNNILGIILGNTELALDDVPEWNPARENLDEVIKACLRAKDVVNQILSFSRQSEFELQPVNIASVVTESLKLLRASIPTVVEIRKHIGEDVFAVLGDATQLHQIMINLCTNAAHAMEEKGGILDITLENMEMDTDAASHHHDLDPGRYVRLQISDTGDGIDPEVKDRIFDPYFTTKEVGKGTGMGLAVVHGIVKGHKGAIFVESEPGKGATFYMFFPALGESPIAEMKEKRKLPTGDERILFVDDEEVLTNLNTQRLERLGYTVHGETDPSEALALFLDNPDQFDLIITDMTMPKLTGDRLAEEIFKVRPDMPIILCTGYSEKISEEVVRKLGIRKYIEKPFEKEHLARSVREVLDRVACG